MVKSKKYENIQLAPQKKKMLRALLPHRPELESALRFWSLIDTPLEHFK